MVVLFLCLLFQWCSLGTVCSVFLAVLYLIVLCSHLCYRSYRAIVLDRNLMYPMCAIFYFWLILYSTLAHAGVLFAMLGSVRLRRLNCLLFRCTISWRCCRRRANGACTPCTAKCQPASRETSFYGRRGAYGRYSTHPRPCFAPRYVIFVSLNFSLEYIVPMV